MEIDLEQVYDYINVRKNNAMTLEEMRDFFIEFDMLYSVQELKPIGLRMSKKLVNDISFRQF